MQADLCLCLHMHKSGFLIPKIFTYIHVYNLSLSVQASLGLVSHDYDGTQSLAPFSVAPEFFLVPASPLVPLSQLVLLSISSPLQADPL